MQLSLEGRGRSDFCWLCCGPPCGGTPLGLEPVCSLPEGGPAQEAKLRSEVSSKAQSWMNRALWSCPGEVGPDLSRGRPPLSRALPREGLASVLGSHHPSQR